MIAGCAGLNIGPTYKSFAEEYPERAAELYVPALGEYVQWTNQMGQKLTFINLQEIKVDIAPLLTHWNPEDGDYIVYFISIDTDASDNNLDGETDVVLVIENTNPSRDVSGWRVYNVISPESLVDVMDNVSKKLGVATVDITHNARSISIPNGWTPPGLNKHDGNNAASE